MKKREKKLLLHRETVRHLENVRLTAADLAQVQGAGPQTSCGAPDCCGDAPVFLD
jgi:hypothetical protein